jgi:hypothetical protein
MSNCVKASIWYPFGYGKQPAIISIEAFPFFVLVSRLKEFYEN